MNDARFSASSIIFIVWPCIGPPVPFPSNVNNRRRKIVSSLLSQSIVKRSTWDPWVQKKKVISAQATCMHYTQYRYILCTTATTHYTCIQFLQMCLNHNKTHKTHRLHLCARMHVIVTYTRRRILSSWLCCGCCCCCWILPIFYTNSTVANSAVIWFIELR